MSFLRTILLFFVLFFVNFFIAPAQSIVNEKEARTLVTLLDYIAKDYGGAVEDGEIINKAEFEEISEFTETCIAYHENLIPQVNEPVFTSLKGGLENLKKLIQNKADQALIDVQTKDIKNKILALGLIKMSPDKWPSLKSGMMIYDAKCQSCHGAEGKGDGILAGGLDPEPTDFQDPGTLKHLSAVQAYNVAKLGLEGTAMRSFNELSEAELWAVSFYIMSLSHPADQSKLSHLPSGINLDSLSKWTDQTLENYLTVDGSQISVSQIRHYEPERALPLEVASANLDASLQAFLNNDKKTAQQLALSAYLEGVELVENTLKASDKNIVIEIEKAMLAYRNALKGDDEQLVKSTHANASELIGRAQDILDSTSYSFGFTYWAALSILLREALEALLIIVAVPISVSSRTVPGSPRSARPIRSSTVIDRPCAGDSSASAASADETVSRHPREPHRHSGPSSRTCTWPISPAVPRDPRYSRPSMIMPAPMPLDTLTYSRSSTPRPIP